MMVLREIERRDNPGVAALIRTVMPEFGAGGPGFAIHDAEVDAMCEAYSQARSAYFVIADGERVLGGGGIGPLAGGDAETCELRKMYFLPELRGQGWGRRLIEQCLNAAREKGFAKCYLETCATMTAAQALYRKAGFAPLDAPMGETGHCGCNRWYLKTL